MLEIPFLHNMTMQEDILPISLESDDFDKEHYKRKKLNFDKHEKLDLEEDFEKETSIFDHLASDIFIFFNSIDFVNSSYNSDNAII